MTRPLVLALYGVANGTSLADFEGYAGGELDDHAKAVLHDSLDRVIDTANLRARQTASKTRALSRRR